MLAQVPAATDNGRCPSRQAPVPALSGLSKEAQEQQRNDEGGPVKSESESDRHEYKGK